MDEKTGSLYRATLKAGATKMADFLWWAGFSAEDLRYENVLKNFI